MDRSMEIQATGTRLVKLRQKLAARAGVPGYEKNCETLRAEIARLEGSTGAAGDRDDQPRGVRKAEAGQAKTQKRRRLALASKSGNGRRAKPAKVTV